MNYVNFSRARGRFLSVSENGRSVMIELRLQKPYKNWSDKETISQLEHGYRFALIFLFPQWFLTSRFQIAHATQVPRTCVLSHFGLLERQCDGL